MGKKVMAFQPLPKFRKTAKSSGSDPAEQIRQTPTLLLVGGVNAMLQELEHRGVDIVDYDQPGRKLYQIKHIRGHYVFLAAEPDPERAD